MISSPNGRLCGCIALLLFCSCMGKPQTSDEEANTSDASFNASQGNADNAAVAAENVGNGTMEYAADSANNANGALVRDKLSPEDEAYEAGHSQGYDDGIADAESGSDHGTSFDEDNSYKGKVADQYEEGYAVGYDEGFNDSSR